MHQNKQNNHFQTKHISDLFRILNKFHHWEMSLLWHEATSMWLCWCQFLFLMFLDLKLKIFWKSSFDSGDSWMRVSLSIISMSSMAPVQQKVIDSYPPLSCGKTGSWTDNNPHLFSLEWVGRSWWQHWREAEFWHWLSFLQDPELFLAKLEIRALQPSCFHLSFIFGGWFVCLLAGYTCAVVERVCNASVLLRDSLAACFSGGKGVIK